MEVTADGELLPVFEFLADEVGGLAGLEAEGVAAEIYGERTFEGTADIRSGSVVRGYGRSGGGRCGGAVRGQGRDKKPGAKAVQLVLPVFLLSEFQRRFKGLC